MDSRKDQLQKQIIEALKANDNDLYSLLKSQWAHRFGVESLEELENLDLKQLNQNSIDDDNYINKQSKDYSFMVDNEISIKEEDSQEKGVTNDTDKLVKPVEVENNQLFEIKSNEVVDRKNHENKSINSAREYISPPKVEPLIPLPPKPKYSYLRKWLPRS